MSLLSPKVEETTIATTNQNISAIFDEFDLKHGIYDSTTPKETNLSGCYKRSFAYYTFRHRLPRTLSTLLSTLKEELKGSTTSSEEDICTVLESIEKLKKQLESDGQLEKIRDNEPDRDTWNDFISNLPHATFFKSCWLYAECYYYRTLYSFFATSQTLKDYDYFGPQKINALQIADVAMEELIKNTKTSENNFETFSHMLKLALWGNRCDLSISSGQEVPVTRNLFELIDSLNANILIDNSAQIWDCLNRKKQSATTTTKSVDFVCDNAGFELFTDLLLAQFLIKNNLTDVVRFHVKAMPWYVSDTTDQDVRCTLRYLQEHKSENLNNFGKQCSKYFAEANFQVAVKEYFWTTPYEYYRMNEVNPSLYGQLQQSSLIIFKGDLNYRKLLGDFNWDFTEQFRKCLRGFAPSNLCTLRTVKGDLICGLEPGMSEQLTLRKSDWMFTGEFGVIQYAEQC